MYAYESNYLHAYFVNYSALATIVMGANNHKQIKNVYTNSMHFPNGFQSGGVCTTFLYEGRYDDNIICSYIFTNTYTHIYR